ncbi:hypothetical protein K1T71_009185 [Dendrolimus kikuchii]|uniref:Uncharacterized protein n=1 Tax=Dendrolimus kikuchii TaxID=765133 RepID=A0ACC1CUD9_9NEOP|nr:hypothetical protein K1T71_009185 [Dendrolimus kikuchii]
MFWGLIMEPNKRYTQVVEKPFHISQAAMDTSTGDTDPCQVMVVVEGKNFLICTLQKNKTVQVPLDMYFKTGDAVSFLINGKCNVHLTGYLDPEFDDTVSEDDEEEEQDEAPITNKRKLLDAPENSVNKKAKHDKKTDKKVVAAESSDDDDDDGDSTLRKILDGEDIDTDENDESFQMNSSAYSSSDDDEDDDGDDDEEKEDEEDDDEKDEEEAETTLDTSKEEKLDMSKLSKSQKRRLKKKLQQQSKQQQQPQVNGVDKSSPAKKEKQDKKAEKKKPEAKNGTQEGQATEKKEKKALNGGVMIEDTKVGSGAVAKPGKVVMVYYEGRLKENKKMFDNCMKGPGFKFRLGAKEVISGWDVGIVGMKVGGKRRIICPPSMAYGAKGSPPAIPPNSTLVFEVELKNIK